jgi:hypothetical protein
MIGRVRKIRLAYPGTIEKLSHGDGHMPCGNQARTKR